MIKYKEFAPTMFDGKGAFLPDRGEWWVAPTMQNRDSGTLTQSNFACALELIGGEGEDVEVHRFGHWGPGWFELILVRPMSEAAGRAARIEANLEDYPVVNEEDWSRREWEAAASYWEQMGTRERIEACKRFRVSIFAARRDELPDSPTGGLIPYLADGC